MVVVGEKKNLNQIKVGMKTDQEINYEVLETG